MPLSEVTALEQQSHKSAQMRFHIDPYDSYEDQKTLEELAGWCHRFSPLVGLAEEEPVETLLLDVTGIAPLFGGEVALIEQIETAFRQQHLSVRIGLGSTVGAAWALAHYSHLLLHESSNRDGDQDQPQCVRPRVAGEPAASAVRLISTLPVAALRLPATIVETLNRLGLERISDLLPLPRDELKARFGTILLQRLDQALGKQQEVIAQILPPSDFAADWIFEHPVAQQSVIQEVIKQLIERLSFMLLQQAMGALQLSYRLTLQGKPVAFEVGCLRPSTDAEHLWQLTEMQLDRLVLREPVTSISICASRHARLNSQQQELFAEHIRHDSPLMASLIDRMASRLGRKAVVRCILQSDPQPEKAYRYEPLVGGSRPRKSTVRRSPFSLLDRPTHLLAKPVALANCTVASDGSPAQFQYDDQQHTVARHWGPERIETGWWRHGKVQRDYYRVETTLGFRFWVFRSFKDWLWFLHGTF